MKEVDALIIGSSAAGFAAAITARRHYPDATLALIRQEEKTLVPCGIPYIFGTLGSPEKNLMPDPALAKNNVELIVDRVTEIDGGAKTVATIGGQTIGYEKLLLATGSLPLVPPIPGADLENVFVIQKDVAYLTHLLEVLKEARDVVIIGGGFIGLEMADECRKLGHPNITVVEMLSHCLFLVFDEDLCVRVEEEVTKTGIQLRASKRAKSLVGNGKVEYVELENGERLKADAVILGIGVRPNTELAQQAGLEIGPTGAVAVDRHMMTSDPNIFAAGDCAEKVSSSGLAGIRERDAIEAGIAYVVGEAESPDKHPGSLPGATRLRVKLVFRKYSGTLIGGQVCGGDTVGELVNLIAAMIQAEMNVDQIATFQMGTHPLLTASPVAYQVVNAAEIALGKMR
jgi:NADPH-dependent 2,4-dienoyl-CoA reductase/sulfur reductase-like enzyme